MYDMKEEGHVQLHPNTTSLRPLISDTPVTRHTREYLDPLPTWVWRALHHRGEVNLQQVPTALHVMWPARPPTK